MLTTESLIDRELRKLAPPGVRVGARSINPADVTRLHPAELSAVERAIAPRRVEFASGRALLRALLHRDITIGVRSDRSPRLPAGVCGSLAHDRSFAIAAVSSDPHVMALGVDIEPDTPIDRRLSDTILRTDEQVVDAHLAFTLKEAAYKAWSSLGGRVLDHHDVRLDVGAGSFTATVLDDGTRLDGRHAHVGDRWLALVVVTC